VGGDRGWPLGRAEELGRLRVLGHLGPLLLIRHLLAGVRLVLPALVEPECSSAKTGHAGVVGGRGRGASDVVTRVSVVLT
jgi:hypothetical protein